MQDLVNNLLPRLESLGSLAYWVVFLVAILESLPFVGILIPGSIILVGIGFFAAGGTFHITDLIWAASLGAVVSDSIGYYLGKNKGRKFFDRKWRFINTASISKTDAYFKAHGGKSVFIGRFIGIFRPFIAFVAGMHQMEYKKFLFYNITSGLLWSITYILIGFYFGDQSKSIAQWLGRSMYIVLAGTVIFSVIFFLWKKKCGKKGS